MFNFPFSPFFFLFYFLNNKIIFVKIHGEKNGTVFLKETGMDLSTFDLFFFLLHIPILTKCIARGKFFFFISFCWKEIFFLQLNYTCSFWVFNNPNRCAGFLCRSRTFFCATTMKKVTALKYYMCDTLWRYYATCVTTTYTRMWNNNNDMGTKLKTTMIMMMIMMRVRILRVYDDDAEAETWRFISPAFVELLFKGPCAKKLRD